MKCHTQIAITEMVKQKKAHFWLNILHRTMKKCLPPFKTIPNKTKFQNEIINGELKWLHESVNMKYFDISNYLLVSTKIGQT